MSTIKYIQKAHKGWTANNFGEQPYWHPLLGVVEEVGELAHAELKREQGIRTNQDHDAMAKDAVGDILIYLIGYCNKKGYDMEDILTETWESVVSKRNWKKNPENGVE